MRLNPDTGEKRQIIVARAMPSTPTPAGSAQITDIAVAAKGPLRAGDSFTVTLHGTPGGKATFDIGTYLTGLPLPEAAPPGTYTTKYTVPQGVNFSRTTVYGHLTVGGSDAPRAEAPQLVAVTTTPPQIVDIAPPGGADRQQQQAVDLRHVPLADRRRDQRRRPCASRSTGSTSPPRRRAPTSSSRTARARRFPTAPSP